MNTLLRKYYDSRWDANPNYRKLTPADKELFLDELERLIEEGDIDIKNGEVVYFDGGPLKLYKLLSIAERFFSLRYKNKSE